METSDLKKQIKEIILSEAEDPKIQVIGLGRMSRSTLCKNIASSLKALSHEVSSATAGPSEELNKIGLNSYETLIHKLLTLRAFDMGTELPRHTKIISK